MERIRVTSDRVKFSQIPHWVLSGSSNAVKLYCVLMKYANAETAEAYPSRAKIAEDMGFKRLQSVDPIVAELESMGAIRVHRTKNGGKNAPNVYHMLWEKPEQPQDVVVRSDALFDIDDAGIVRSGAGNSTVQPHGIVRSTVPELYPDNYNQEPDGSSARAEAENPPTEEQPEIYGWREGLTARQIANRRTPEGFVADELHVQTRGALSFIAMRPIMKWALENFDVTPNQLGVAVMGMFQRNTGVTRQSLGAELMGFGRKAQASRSTTDDRISALQALKNATDDSRIGIGK